MAEMNSPFAKRMMAQKLMMDNKPNPFEKSEFFQPSDAFSQQRTRQIQGPMTLGNIASYFMPFSKDIGPYDDSPRLDQPGGVNVDFPPIAKDAYSGIMKFGQALRGELSPKEIKQLAFDTSLNVTGGSLLGSALTKSVPKNALSMGLSSGSNEKSILEQLKTLRSNLKNTTSKTEKTTIEKQILDLKNQREQELINLRKEGNIARFGYDPNDPSTLPNTSYRIQHQPRGPKDETPVRLDDLTKSTTGEKAGYPDDFYTPRGQSIYAQGPSFSGDEYGLANIESYNIIKNIRGRPNADVIIYRGVPDEDSIKTINPGDFVTLSKKYAQLHAASGYGVGGKEAGKIIEKKVKVKDIYWDQNDVNEFGYFPESD